MHFLRLVLVVACCAGGVAFAPAAAQAQSNGLFGSVEFRAGSLQGLPRWERVVNKLPSEVRDYSTCDANPNACDSSNMANWREFIARTRGKPMQEMLDDVNRFGNQWRYINDNRLWGKSDYWATPKEFIDNSGDCEDYAIFKYVTLKQLGVPVDNLRIVVLQDTVRDLAHAVLSVQTGGSFYILDNLHNRVMPHTALRQYKPYYSVNEYARWAHITND